MAKRLHNPSHDTVLVDGRNNACCTWIRSSAKGSSARLCGEIQRFLQSVLLSSVGIGLHCGDWTSLWVRLELVELVELGNQAHLPFSMAIGASISATVMEYE